MKPLDDILRAMDDGPVAFRVASADHGAVIAARAALTLDCSLVLVVPTETLMDRISLLVRWLLDHGPSPRLFPKWPKGADTPYDDVVESPFVAASRLGTLGVLCLSETPSCLVLDATRATRRLIPFDAFMDGVYRVEVGRTLDLGPFSEHLVAAGYRRVETVCEVGEFAIRGGIVDLYSPYAEDPVRFDLDGDVVAGLWAFDPATQRSQRTLFHTFVVPVWEVPVAQQRLREAFLRLAEAAATAGSGDAALIERTIASGRLPPGFGAMLPVFHGPLDTILAYLPQEAVVAVLEGNSVIAAADATLSELEQVHGGLCNERRVMAPPQAIVASGAEFLAMLKDRPRTMFLDVAEEPTFLGPESAIMKTSEMTRATASSVDVRERVSALGSLAEKAVEAGERLILLAPSEDEARRVREIMTSLSFDPAHVARHGMAALFHGPVGLSVGVGRIRAPFGIEALLVTVIPSEAVFGVKDALAHRRAERRGAKALLDLRDLEPGDLVVHREHGIGRYLGLREVTAMGVVSECLVIEYRDGDKLFLPVDRANLVEKYISQETTAASQHALDRLGGTAWRQRKRAARHAAREIAQKLKTLYARRCASTAHAFSPPDAEFREFETTFPYETTADQERAIEDVIADMCQERPMDRLVCGDVGFGKTEVAIRAAYLAVLEGKQAAVLVPTTILAEQHRVTFAARLRNTPVVVEAISRLRSPQEERRILEGLRKGTVDIVIGTHRLLSKDVVFRDLGLLVVDEEHRFGVEQKERLREIAANVHTLTLSATPIPRTLHMALSGIRELSIIATPPRDRLAVRTFVARESNELYRSAITRELKRGGQVFVVHNRVEDIYEYATRIAALVPQARIGVAHGQMTSSELEAVMAAFVRGDKDCLVCTTIIESGLDIANANTMLIHDAGSLGLAQLYQLRGRVGRSSEQAYCYLLLRDPSTMTEEARRRIEAIERFSELSSGFNLAAMDMEIRGAGNVLGAEQSGHLAAVGYELFMEMIQDAVAELLGAPVQQRLDPELKVDVDARIPASLVPNEAQRLRFYRRLSAARDLSEVASIASELSDRYGKLPVPARQLIDLMRIKVLMREKGFARLHLKAREATFVAAMSPPDAAARLYDVLISEGARPSLLDSTRVQVAVPTVAQALKWIFKVLSAMGSAEGD